MINIIDPMERYLYVPVSKKSNIIVFSHLRWEFVTQRPQHIITRLAKNANVLFVEEPIGYMPEEEGSVNLMSINENITVIQPRIDPGSMIDALENLIKQHFSAFLYPEAPVLWFYSAAFHELTERLSHALVIYDCMDELAAFKGASQLLVHQEQTLMQKADLVFTGGKSLYEAKKPWNNATYCYPSSVDRAHFEKALDYNTLVPEDIKHIPRPMVGYYGVIDERIDYELLDQIAQLNPEVSFVMIGPVVKVDPAALPRRHNLHFLGGRQYEVLPGYLKAFDVAMMPFALNESTRYISPTKTLEYIAALKPVISTPVFDVVRDYSPVLSIVEDADEFTAALQSILEETPYAISMRIRRYNAILDAVSWDKTVAAMQCNMNEAMLASEAENQTVMSAA